MLTILLKEESDQPFYTQIYQEIRKAIAEGRLSKDEKLPSKRYLANHLGVSQTTVLSAYHQLIEEGYLYSKEKRGYYVADISNLAILPEKPKPLNVAIPETVPSIDGIEEELFPYNIFRRLLQRILNERPKALLNMCEPAGYAPLRKEIANYLLNARGFHCQSEQIIIRPSTEDLFSLLFNLLPMEPHLGIENPGYHQLLDFFKSRAIPFSPIALDKNGASPQSLNKTAVNCLYVTPSHQFPTGIIMPIRRRQQLQKWATEGIDRFIIEDDYDSEFKYTGKPIPPLKSLDTQDNVIYMGNFSKSISPSLRISYMVLPNRLLHRFIAIQDSISCHCDVMSQLLLTAFMEEGYFERHINRVRKHYRKKREALVAIIQSLDSAAHFQGANAGLHLIFTPSRPGKISGELHPLSTYYLKIPKESAEKTLVLPFSGIPLNTLEQTLKDYYA